MIVTMMYLGQGLPGNAQDEMKVLQQICGGENICVFKGFVQPGGKAHYPVTTLNTLLEILCQEKNKTFLNKKSKF